MSTLGSLSQLAVDRGRYQEALPLARECMSVAREFSSKVPITAIEPFGKALYANGAYAEAEELFQESLALIREREDFRYFVPSWLFQLGKIAFRTGDYARAEEQFQESLAGALAFENLKLVARNQNALGRLNLAQEKYIPANEHMGAALQTAITLGWPPITLAILATAAELFAEVSDLGYAALLATFTSNHPACQAKVKERADRLLTRLEAELPADDLVKIRQASGQSDLDALATQLLIDLERA